MNREIINISGKECHLFVQPNAQCLLIQPVDEHDLEPMAAGQKEKQLLEQEIEIIQTLSGKPFSLAAFKIDDWNQELTPWTAPPVFGKEPFGDGAEKTLAFITEHLLPALQGKEIDTTHCIIGGYSLAGLFALWAAYQTERVEAVAAVSPSVWYPDWIKYTIEKRPFAHSIYLSLGDKEEKAKNPIMAQVGYAIRQQEKILQHQGVNTILEWNSGNHFVDSEKRMAKGFSWTMNHIATSERG